MKACSFLPAATKMIYDMGLQQYLYGVTFECPVNPLDKKPKVVRCMLEGNDYSSAEIDRIFSASKAKGKSFNCFIKKTTAPYSFITAKFRRRIYNSRNYCCCFG